MRLRRDSSSGGPRLGVPVLLSDLYWDLRDRHLLPLVAVLLAAIVAVPFLLAGRDDGEPGPEPPAASASGAGAGAEASFAVVPANPGLRDYRRRLGHRQPQDPFSAPRPQGAGAAAVATTPAGGGGAATPAAESTGGGETGAPAAAGGSAPESSAPAGSGSGGSGSGGQINSSTFVVQQQVIGYKVDAHAGFLGHLRDREGIAPTAKLPNKKNPVVVFMGLTPDGKRALFLMTSNVTAYYGKGRCAFEKESCQLLELKPGKSATFAYGYGSRRYKLTLKRIVPVVKDSRRATSTTVVAGADRPRRATAAAP